MPNARSIGRSALAPKLGFLEKGDFKIGMEGDLLRFDTDGLAIKDALKQRDKKISP